MNTEKLEKLKKSLDNKFIPDNMKDKIRAEIKKLEADIKTDETITATEVKEEVKEIEKKVEKALEVAEEKEEKAEKKETEKAIKKTAMAVAKTIRKDGEKWSEARKRANDVMKKEKVDAEKTTKSELERLLAKVRKNKSLMAELEGVKDLGRDASRHAKPVGKRVSANGNVYYEYRPNKTDRKTYGKYAFADGGDVEKPKELKGYFVHILKSPYDSKMNVVPTTEKIILVTDGKKGDSFSVMSNEPHLKLVERTLFGKKYIHAEPVNFEGTTFKQKMFGGNFVWSSDSRFRDDVSELPVPLHDRIEYYEKGGGLETPYNVVYLTKSGRGMIAKNIMAKNEEEAKVKLEKQMRASTSFDKVVMVHEAFELGGSVVTDLAGHQDGTFGVGNNSMLDGFSGTNYTGLVGETGAMSSGELFAGGGSIGQMVNFEDWQLYDRDTDLERMKKSCNAIRKNGFKAIVVEDTGMYYVLYKSMSDTKGKRVYANGGAVGMANQQVIDNASQSYVNYYLGEGASAGIFKDGGAIENQYKDKTAKEVWNLWTLKQREHFLADHYDVIEPKDIGSYNKKYDELEFLTQIQLDLHIEQGQYANGGGVRKMSEWSVSITSEDGDTFDWVGFAKNEDDALYKAEQEAGFESVESGVTEITDSKGKKIEYATGGGVRKVGNREYSTGRNWTNDHRHVNKSEEHEVNYIRKKSFAKGGYTNERRHVNKAQDYEVRYAKNKPNRTGYLGKRSFDEGGISNGRYEVVKVIGFDKNGKTLPKNEIKVIADFDSRKEALNFVYEQQFKKDVTQRDIFIRDTKTNKTFAEGGFMTDPNFGDFQNQVYATGGVTKNYIGRNELNTITIKKGDKKLTYKISDVLNGAYKLESGAKLEDIAFYVPKRNIVKVQLKTGKDFKPANGYWIKDGAKPIHVTKYDDGGMTEKEFMQKEINSQKEIEKGKVFKKYRVNVYENGFPFVEPLMTDNLLQAINFAKKTIEEQRKYRANSKDLFAEISEFTPIEKRDNVRYAYNRIGSLSEEDLKSSKYNDGGQLEMKFLKGGKLESKIQKKVDEVNSLIEKAIDKDGDPIMVVDKSGTWQEPMQYKPIVYKNGRLYFEYYEPYSGKTQKEVINKSNVEFDGYPMLLDIAKMYRIALKEKGVSFSVGGKTTFKEKATAIAKNFEGKRVEPKYQKKYGKVYDKEEAKEVGNKIAGSQKAKYDAKLEKGSEVKKRKGNHKMKATTDLARKIRKEGEKWTDAIKRASEQLK